MEILKNTFLITLKYKEIFKKTHKPSAFSYTKWLKRRGIIKEMFIFMRKGSSYWCLFELCWWKINLNNL